MASSLSALKSDLAALADPARAKASLWFFKTAPGQYGHGDKFLGIRVPQQRQIAKKYRDLSLSDLDRLLESQFHEHRLVALLILVSQFSRGDGQARQAIFDFYLSHTHRVNNWDLVDLSAPHIVGGFLLHRDRQVLYRLARSASLWERRIAVLATFSFIRVGQFTDAFKICELLLPDSHDLIHKATGWALREIAKQDQSAVEAYLTRHIRFLPRTTLRYAIERFSPPKRQHYLHLH